jgi:exopolysaccharide biosynthesis polyprenyl glycosylphosphotransferase
MAVTLPLTDAALTFVAVCAVIFWTGYRLSRNSLRLQRVLIVGGGPLAQELIAEIEARPGLGQRVVGLVEDSARALPPRCPWLGHLDELDRVVAEVRPHRVIVALASRRGRMPFKSLFALRLRGVIVQDGGDAYERLTGKVPIQTLNPSSLLFGREFRDFQWDLWLARAVSVPVAAVGLLLLMPLLVLIAVVVKLESPGPLFFVQDRAGRKGKSFRLVKFRTMRPVPRATSEWERDNHSRLTRVGRWLRRLRLDELPQLLNVVKGDMNLVGPRPHPVSNVPLFSMVMRNTPECGTQVPYYALRSMVRPGLTGWAQVRYHYANDLEEEIEKMRYDLYYIKHRSAWLDVRILFETISVVLRGPDLAEPVGASGLAPELVAVQSVPALRLAADETRATTVAPVLARSAATPKFDTTFGFEATPVPRPHRAGAAAHPTRREAPLQGGKV